MRRTTVGQVVGVGDVGYEQGRVCDDGGRRQRCWGTAGSTSGAGRRRVGGSCRRRACSVVPCKRFDSKLQMTWAVTAVAGERNTRIPYLHIHRSGRAQISLHTRYYNQQIPRSTQSDHSHRKPRLYGQDKCLSNQYQ